MYKVNKAYPLGLLLTQELQVILPPLDEDFDEDFSDEKIAKEIPKKQCKVPLRVLDIGKELLKLSDRYFNTFNSICLLSAVFLISAFIIFLIKLLAPTDIGTPLTSSLLLLAAAYIIWQ